MMNLLLVGANHRSAPMDLRERLHVPRHALPQTLEELKRVEGVEEGLLLSTCNRTELLARFNGCNSDEEPLIHFLSQRHSLAVEDLKPHLYRLRDLDAVRHLFRVAASLDSLVLGEPQILGQVKEAYLASRECRALGTVLGGLMQHAFAVAKKIRTRTGIARNPVSVSQVAVSLAKQIFGTLTGKTVMLLGAGEMSELAAQRLLQEGVRTVIVSSRTYERAGELAQRFRGVAVPFERFAEHFESVDIVISSTGAPHFVLQYEQIVSLMRHRRGRPVFLIDIAMPRDIDPRVNSLDNVYLYDIDDLEKVATANRREREQDSEMAESLIEQEVAAFSSWFRTLEVGPAIAALREHCLRLQETELEHFLKKHQELSGDFRQDLQVWLRGLVNKLLHEPTVRLKRALGSLDESSKIEVVGDLFSPRDTPQGSGRQTGDDGASSR